MKKNHILNYEEMKKAVVKYPYLLDYLLDFYAKNGIKFFLQIFKIIEKEMIE